MNKLTINGHSFTDSKIVNGNLTLFSSVISDSLEADECVFTLVQGDTARFITADYKRFVTADGKYFCVNDSFDFGALKYGDEMKFEKDGATHLFYLKSVERVSVNAYQLVGQSIIGMLASVNYPGGVYHGETAGEVIDDIFGTALEGAAYHYTQEIADQALYGWIPWGDCRSALQQILFAIGAVVTRYSDGLPFIHFPTDAGRITIPDSKVGLSGSIELGEKVTEIDLIEYTFFPGSWDTLFDNSQEGEDAFHTRVIFDTPAFEFEVEGTLEIEELGYNYAVVSGRGALNGQLYSNSKKELRATVSTETAEKVATIKECYLVSPANSFNVLARLKSYYQAQQNINSELALIDGLVLEAGDAVQLSDAFRQTRQGFVKSLSEPISGIIKASAKIDCGWTPQSLGNTFDVSRRAFFDESGTWQKPAGVSVIYVALIGGGQGGENGEDGKPGGSAGDTMGGNGGDVGACGEGGAVWVSTYTVPEQELVFNISIGAGGASNLGAGGDTSLSLGSTEIASSAEGALISSGYGWTDAFTGDSYAKSGRRVEYDHDLHRYEGAKGGGGGSSDWHPSGYDFDEEYTGGTGGANYRGDTYFANGGCGGGGAYGGDGSAGTNATDGYGGNGGRGADAAAGFDGIDYGYGYGGGGGHGGGGGGAGGPVTKDGTVYPNRQGTGGAGGSGGAGGRGGSGCCIIYY